MSADLSWQVIRNNSAFLRRQRGIKKHFSTEPFNLKGINSQQYNGLVNKKGLDIQVSADKKSLVVASKTRHQRFPAKSAVKVTLKGKGGRATVKRVKNLSRSQNKRHILVAARRASQLLRSIKRSTVKKTA